MGILLERLHVWFCCVATWDRLAGILLEGAAAATWGKTGVLHGPLIHQFSHGNGPTNRAWLISMPWLLRGSFEASVRSGTEAV